MLVREDEKLNREKFFDELYQKNVHYVWGSLRKLGIAHEERADFVHEVFLIVWRRFDEIDHTKSFHAFLFGIAYYVVKNSNRQKRRRPIEFIESEKINAIQCELPNQEINISENEDRSRAKRIIHEALLEMDIDKRAIFVLHDIEGQNVADCARTLNMSVNTLYSRLRSARDIVKSVAHRIAMEKT